MKAKRLFVILLSMLVTFAFVGFTVACSSSDEEKPKTATELTIDSKTETTIEVGAEYTLIYTCNGEVTVKVTGDTAASGTYNKETKKFSATAVGVYTLEVTGTESGKAPTTKTVKITVVAGADKTALAAALEMANGYTVSSDYTAESWARLVEAKTEAQKVLNGANETADVISGTITLVNNAINGLVPAPITKATATDTEITFGTDSYLAEDYSNFATVKGKVDALNANSSVKLNSEYAKQIAEILDELASKLKLNVTGAPVGTYIAAAGSTYEINADVDDGSTVSWKVNGEAVTTGVSSDGKTLTFAPTEFGNEYEIAVTASAATGTANTKTFKSTFVKADYVNNIPDKINVTNNKITVNEGLGWDDNKGRKVVLKDLNLYGEFTVEMNIDVTNSNGENDCVALFLLNQDGGVDDGQPIVVYKVGTSNFFAIEQGDDKPNVNYPDGVSNKNLHVRIFRIKKEDGKFYLRGAVIKADGTPVYTAEKECTGNRITLGLQVENAICSISDIKLIDSDAAVMDRTVIAAAKVVCDNNDLNFGGGEYDEDYGQLVKNFNVTGKDDELITAYVAARQEIYDAYYDAGRSPEAVTAAIAVLEETQKALFDVKKDVVKATFDEDAKTITYGKTYDSTNYSNITDVIELIKAVNAEDYEYITQYELELNDALSALKLALEVTITSTPSLDNNSVIYDWTEGTTYAFNVSASINNEAATCTYAWYLNDGATPVSNNSSYNLTATQGTHTLKVDAVYGTGDDDITVSKTFKVAFEKANVNVHDGVTGSNGTFTAETGIKWDTDYEGRKVVFDELIFNGSFSAQMDVTFNTKVVGANVVTFHLLNADTLSRNNGRDKAIVGYGCICLHENPVRLETGGNAIVKKQSDGEQNPGEAGGNWEVVNPLMKTVSDKLGSNNSFTVRLDVYRDKNGRVSYDFSVFVDNQWITFARENDWGGDFGGGFIVGVNIENAGVTLSNFKFNLLEAGERGNNHKYIAGSVKSKADLYNAYTQYKSVDASLYVNGGAFVNAHYAAYNALCDNSATADYVTSYANLKAAYEALVERSTVSPTVVGLDAGYNEYRGYDKFTATGLPDGATQIKWTYGFLAADAELKETTVDSAELALAAGAYSNVKLSFQAGGETYEFTYQDFVVKDITFRMIEEFSKKDGSIKIVGKSWEDPLEQLVLEGVRPHEFELTLDLKYDSGNVMAFRLSGTDVRMVIRSTAGSIGFDEDGDEAYAFMPGGALTKDKTYKIRIRAINDGSGIYTIKFALSEDDGATWTEVTRKNTWGGRFDDKSTSTDFNITSEHVNGTLSNFKVMYN